MAKTKKKRDPIPEHFKSIEEAGEFWDTHDLTEYLDQTRPVHLDVGLKTHRYLTALEPELAKQLLARARPPKRSSTSG